MYNSDLGYYQYELNLKAVPAPPEKPIRFQTVLGSSQSIVAKFTNYTRQKTEYFSKVSRSFFCQNLGSEIMGGKYWNTEETRYLVIIVIPASEA